MRLRAKLGFVAIAAASGGAWGVSLWQWMHPPLGPALRAALARAAGVDEAAVSVGSARLGWPLTLEARDVATGEWAAARDLRRRRRVGGARRRAAHPARARRAAGDGARHRR